MSSVSRLPYLDALGYIDGDVGVDHDAPSGRSDEDVLRGALSGDAASVRELIRRLQPAVQGPVAMAVLSYRRSQSVRLEVEDLVQEVWSRLFAEDGRILRAYRPERGPLAPFIRVVANRLVVDALRSGRKNPWRERPASPEDLERDATLIESVEGRVGDRLLLEHVVAELRAQLGDKGREALEVMYLEGASVAEAAEATGMTPNALHMWRKRIAKMARAVLERVQAEGGCCRD